MTRSLLYPWVLLLISSHVICTLITVMSQNGKGNTKCFSPSKTATAADSARHGSVRHRCKYRDATWQNSIMRAENITSKRNTIIKKKKKKGRKPHVASIGSIPSVKEETRSPFMVCVEWHLCSSGHNARRMIPFQLCTSLYHAILVKSRGHHNTGKSILLKPGSLRRSQYVLLLTQVSLLDFLQIHQLFSSHP